MPIRITQKNVEVVQGDPSVRVTQHYLETVRDDHPPLRVTQEYVEVANGGHWMNLSQLYVEIVMPNRTLAKWKVYEV